MKIKLEMLEPFKTDVQVAYQRVLQSYAVSQLLFLVEYTVPRFTPEYAKAHIHITRPTYLIWYHQKIILRCEAE